MREVPTKTGPVDYLLFGDGKALGTIEAKKEGETLRGVEWQTERYTQGFSELVEERPIPHWEPLPLPFHYQSTGAETLFTNLRDPIARPRDVFHFHRPETLIALGPGGVLASRSPAPHARARPERLCAASRSERSRASRSRFATPSRRR